MSAAWKIAFRAARSSGDDVERPLLLPPASARAIYTPRCGRKHIRHGWRLAA
jgi:hypothetical protein